MKKTLFMAVLLVLALACARTEEQLVAESEPSSQAVVTNEGLPDDCFYDGCINVKVTPAFAEEIESNTDGDGIVDVSKVKSMGFAVEDLGIVRMTRLFPYAGKFEERTRAEGLHLWYEIRYDEDKSVTKASGDLRLIDGIEIVDPKPIIVLEGSNEVAEYMTTSAAAPSAAMPFDDPDLEKQWHYYNDGSASSAQSGCDINVFPVWSSYTTGDPDVIVAVVDGGIDYEHEDLADNMWHDPEDTRRVGYNFCTNNYAITPHDHGTHVAGTIAAVNNNGKGLCGIAGGDYKNGKKGVKLMSCQIFSDNDGGGSGEQAIKWGADHGAVIAQNSWGLSKPASTSSALKAAVDYFIKYAGFDEKGVQVGPMAGGLVVFAAGNENSSEPYGNDYEKMLIVTSVGADYRRAYYSNYGDWCHIAAPGGDAKKGNQVWSTLPGNQYGKMQGTSMACPHVSGVAALVLSKKGKQGYTCQALRDALVNHTTDISAYNRSTYMGSGLVNAYMAIAGSGGKAPEMVKEYTLETNNSNTVIVSMEVPSDPDDNKANSLIVYYSTSPISSTDGLMFSNFYVGDLEAGDTLEGKVTGLEFSTRYYFTVVACDLAGNKAKMSSVKNIMTGINHAPVIDPQGPFTLSFKAHETERVKFSYSDPDDHYMAIEHTAASEAEVLDTTIMDKPVLVITGADAPDGSYSSRIIITDVYGMADTLDVNYTILANHPPVVVKQIPNQVFGSKTDSNVLNEKDYFNDEDGEQLTYTIENTDESVINVNYSKGKFYLTPMGYGMADITITATDVRGETAVQSFKVLVRDSNEPADIYPNPVHDILNIRTSEDASVSIKIVGMQGSVMYDSTQSVSPFSPAAIDVKDYPAGAYTVSLQYGSNSIKKTIVKI